jgi:hypothetical protein
MPVGRIIGDQAVTPWRSRGAYWRVAEVAHEDLVRCRAPLAGYEPLSSYFSVALCELAPCARRSDRSDRDRIANTRCTD